MRCLRTVSELREALRTRSASLTTGFVPTMGNLHAGHLSLLERSVAENTRTIASIFVNPTQFNAEADFRLYPRTLDDDLALLEKAGVAYCFHPDPSEMYPDDFSFQVQENRLALPMEGNSRPGHFTGMLTVVLKLLNLTRPTRAYFGEKDYQQASLVSAMVKAFFLETDIIVCPTIREASGLPFSSRNRRLNAEQRQTADTFARIFHAGSPLEATRNALEAAGIAVDYLEEHAGRRFVAVKIGDIRLIDNTETLNANREPSS
ncbi:pantoate--beta-alanine ligase [Legionella geestiana]|uniref:pantoate--beta-alanine ligase n=1 Tax=Legionella geestiana TaxID=45065 RepID=UPI001091B19F|nr:pantoate--beta-alanine ligase [Legionella geestiana]QDQ40113.1 pantoate--beta-alanine ligase [Legionella geestiana]